MEFLLESSTLCTLATVGHDTGASDFDAYPETSLMFFTWVPEERAIVFTTPTEGLHGGHDLKFRNIQRTPKVSMLFHNFDGGAASSAMFHSRAGLAVTAYGHARVLRGEEDATFRAMLLRRTAANNGGAYIKPDSSVIVKVDIEGWLAVTINGEVLRLLLVGEEPRP